MMHCLLHSSHTFGQPRPDYFFLDLEALPDWVICGGLVMQCLVLWNGDSEQDGRRGHKSSSQDELRPSFSEHARKALRHRSAKQWLFAAPTGICIGEMFRNGKRGFLWNATTFGVKRSFGDMRGDLVPDACSSVPTGTVLADRRVAVLDVPSSHSLSQQVNLLGVGPQLPHTSNESPRSPWTAAAGLPLGRNISKKYGSESTLEVSGKRAGGVWTAVISMIIPQITPNPPKIPVPAASCSLTYEPRSYNSLSTWPPRRCVRIH